MSVAMGLASALKLGCEAIEDEKPSVSEGLHLVQKTASKIIPVLHLGEHVYHGSMADLSHN